MDEILSIDPSAVNERIMGKYKLILWTEENIKRGVWKRRLEELEQRRGDEHIPYPILTDEEEFASIEIDAGCDGLFLPRKQAQESPDGSADGSLAAF